MHRKIGLNILIFMIFSSFVTTGGLAADDAREPPIIPVGLDAYRMWDRWAYQRIGVRAYMRSTYDRSGGNETADASHYLYQEADDFNVSLDVEGRGILYFARYNHWHGSPWHYEVDGVDHIVKETTTANPLKKLTDSVFIPEKLFPTPLTWTYATTKGADLMWVPIAFEDRFRMAYSRTFYGTGYYIYHRFFDGAQLSQPIKAWDGKTPPDQDVLDLLSRSGTDIAPKFGADGPEVNESSGALDLAAGITSTVVRLGGTPTMLRALKLSVSEDQAIAFGKARIRITWDERNEPSVDAPVALFFGSGTLHNRDGKKYLVKAFPVNVRFEGGRVHLATYFPMPFFRSARIELVGPEGGAVKDVRWQVRTQPYSGPANHVGYFHATYRNHGDPTPGEDLLFLDTEGVEDSRDWTGSFVGTSFIFSDRAILTTLEGDPRFFFDDSQTPQAYGTGTEEWGGGGDYWGGLNMTLPLAGHPVGVMTPGHAKHPEDLIESAYRYLLADLMPFGKRAIIRFEHGGTNDAKERYQSVTYWYGLPGASMVLTDEIDIGDASSEKAHGYFSPGASAPREINSRYEWGVDHEVFESMMSPFVDPDGYADFEFEADAGKDYYVWVRGKVETPGGFNASWFQFDDDIGTLNVSETIRGPFGIIDKWAWVGPLPGADPEIVRFKESGTHRLRIQGRFAAQNIDQIWLSTTQSSQPTSGDARETASHAGGPNNEIVLDAGDARIAGNFKLEPNEEASTGQVLRVIKSEARMGEEVYASHTELERHTTGATEFTVKILPENLGVLLRRTLDYSFPNQRARVFVASADGGADWNFAGIWYLAGGNTAYHSWPGMSGSGRPGGELAPSDPVVQTSNRQFRDDEFPIPRALSEGKSAIRVRIEFTPVERPLLPGRAIDELAWSEIRYQAYSVVMPTVQLATE